LDFSLFSPSEAPGGGPFVVGPESPGTLDCCLNCKADLISQDTTAPIRGKYPPRRHLRMPIPAGIPFPRKPLSRSGFHIQRLAASENAGTSLK
jgi:hypothetical protein